MSQKPTSLVSRACSRFAALDHAIEGALKSRLTPAQASALLIGTSLFFAGAMIVTSWLLRGSEHAQTATYVLIAVWWIPFSLLTGAACRSAEDVERESD